MTALDVGFLDRGDPLPGSEELLRIGLNALMAADDPKLTRNEQDVHRANGQAWLLAAATASALTPLIATDDPARDLPRQRELVREHAEERIRALLRGGWLPEALSETAVAIGQWGFHQGMEYAKRVVAAELART